jgi:hypothetical protein
MPKIGVDYRAMIEFAIHITRIKLDRVVYMRLIQCKQLGTEK